MKVRRAIKGMKKLVTQTIAGNYQLTVGKRIVTRSSGFVGSGSVGL
jgi:hypothetical protein